MRVLLATLLISSLQGADWIRVRSADVELLTDAPEKTAREMMQRFAQIRSLLPTQTVATVPLRIYLFASEREYRQYAPSQTATGFFHSGLDQGVVVAHVGADLSREVTHEFVHFALSGSDRQKPAWAEEGLAEFYSNAQFRKDGVRLGAPIAAHIEVLKNKPWMTPEELEVPHQETIFYAQSWALVHMLRREPSLPEHISALNLDRLRSYIKNVQTVTVPTPPPVEFRLRVDRVSSLDSMLLRGELALRTDHLSLARELYTRAAAEHPGSASAIAGLGVLAEAEGDRDRARMLLEQSLKLDDRNPAAWFQLGLATGSEEALRKAAELNPDLGEAQLLLGVRATDDGRLEEALGRLEKATRLLPRKSYAWYSLGFAQYKGGQVESARSSIERALQTAAGPEQTAMAQALRNALGQGK